MDNDRAVRYPSSMEKLYYTTPYLEKTTCRIEKVLVSESQKGKDLPAKTDYLVYTDRTIFYPECGGQPGDRGRLGPYEVMDTRKDPNGDSVLVVSLEDGQTAPCEGMELELVLDWSHRYKYMAMHTAQHMLSGLLYTMFGIGTVAVHLGEDYLTIEVGQREVPFHVVDELVVEANKVVREGHRVVYHEMSHGEAQALGLRRSIKVEGDVRIVEIEGVDRIACGGVHVASTSEIGLVYCVKHEGIRGHERLYFKCGASAVDHAIGCVSLCESLALKLSCRTDEICSKLTALTNSLGDAMHERAGLMKKLAQYRLCSSLADGIAAFVEEELELSSFVQASNSMDDIALCVAKPCEDRTLWLIVLKGRYGEIGFSTMKEKVLPLIDAKGGGRPPVFQGSSPCTDKGAIEAFLEGFRAAVK